jgi:hypothetical protein
MPLYGSECWMRAPLHQSDPSYSTHSLLPALYKASKKRPTNIFTLKMATAMSAETLDKFQHSTRLIPESRSFTNLTLSGYGFPNPLNPLKYSGHYMYHLSFHSVTLHLAHRVFLWVSYDSQKQERCFPKNTLTN